MSREVPVDPSEIFEKKKLKKPKYFRKNTKRINKSISDKNACDIPGTISQITP